MPQLRAAEPAQNTINPRPQSIKALTFLQQPVLKIATRVGVNLGLGVPNRAAILTLNVCGLQRRQRRGTRRAGLLFENCVLAWPLSNQPSII